MIAFREASAKKLSLGIVSLCKHQAEWNLTYSSLPGGRYTKGLYSGFHILESMYSRRPFSPPKACASIARLFRTCKRLVIIYKVLLLIIYQWFQDLKSYYNRIIDLYCYMQNSLLVGVYSYLFQIYPSWNQKSI